MGLRIIADFPALVTKFGDHWLQVDEKLVNEQLGVLTLEGGYKREDLLAQGQAASDKIARANDAQHSLDEMIARRDHAKSALQERLFQFRGAVRTYLGATTHAAKLPKLPPLNTTGGQFLKPFKIARGIWGSVNGDTSVQGFTPPLLLANGYDLQAFDADIGSLEWVFNQIIALERAATDARTDRDAVLKAAHARLVAYRVAVPARLGRLDALTKSMPEVTAYSSPTPAPVVLKLHYNEENGVVSLHWTPSSEDTLERYDMRAGTGKDFHRGHAKSVASLGKDVTSWPIPASMLKPGATVCFKLYVVVESGHERGSNTIVVKVPSPAPSLSLGVTKRRNGTVPRHQVVELPTRVELPVGSPTNGAHHVKG